MRARPTSAQEEGHAPPGALGVRLAELLAALSLAMDIGLGQPAEHVLRTVLLSVRLGHQSGASDQELATIYYSALLRFVGCTSDAHETARLTGGDDIGFRRRVAPFTMADTDELIAEIRRSGAEPARVRALGKEAVQAARAHCEVAVSIARRLGMGAGVQQALANGFARWDGTGGSGGLAGDQLPFAARALVVARDFELLVRTSGHEEAVEVLRARRGRAYDPGLVDLILGWPAAEAAPSSSAWADVLSAEPGLPRVVAADGIEPVLEVFADFADAKFPATLGHSRAVSSLAEAAAPLVGCTVDEAARLRRAALVHDLGRIGVQNGIWERPGPLAPWEWERVRLHPYLSERILARCDALSVLAPLAGAHHERLDGSGYYRAVAAPALSVGTRILAAADVIEALTRPRPHRAAYTLEEAADIMRKEVVSGRLDSDAVDAVLLAADAAAPPASIPDGRGGLTRRELEVLSLLCAAASNKRIARELGISVKTVGNHLQHVYDKLGVSTRAAAAMVAMEKGWLRPD